MAAEATDKQKSDRLREQLTYFLQGNRSAVELCMAITYIAHLWDDLVDRDAPRTPAEINQGFIMALCGLPANAFYDQHRFQLQPVFLNAILQWMDANNLERSEAVHDRQMAWMLRASIIQIFCFCAYLIGGFDWYLQVGPDMRKLYQETFNEFNEEMNHA